MTTPIPLRLAQRKRDLEDLIATHQVSARSAGDMLTGINEAIDAYEAEAAERAAAQPEEPTPAPAEERTRAPRRDIRGMVLAFLGTGMQARQHTVSQIAEALELRPQQVRAALEYLRGAGKVETVGGPNGPWKATETRSGNATAHEGGSEVSRPPNPPDAHHARSTAIAEPSDDTADHGREPTLALAQDAAA